MPASEKCGETSVSVDSSGDGSGPTRPVRKARAPPPISTASTDSVGLTRRNTKNAAISGRMRQRIGRNRLDRADGEADDDARQHAGRDGGRDFRDQPRQRPEQSR